MFNFGFDKKNLIIVLCVVAGLWLITRGSSFLLSTLLTLPGILIALTFHEFAHAWAAVRLGDDTPKYQGRLNLNPLSHIDPMGFIFLIIAGFGWGKPVQIDPRNFNGKHSISKAEAIVSAAGPIMNFILAFIFMIIYYAIYKTTTINIYTLQNIWQLVLYYIVSINIGLGIFNLIPIPPLDGSKILMHFLPYKGKQWFYENEKYFYIAFLLIVITGISSYIIYPVIDGVHNGIAYLVKAIFGLFI